FYDTFALFNSYSHIDQIWSNLFASSLEDVDILNNLNTESDHNIITLEITILLTQNPLIKQKYRQQFSWKDATQEQISNY
ncbi:4715_t:CDS:1, partial [Gigaspora margarita]